LGFKTISDAYMRVSVKKNKVFSKKALTFFLGAKNSFEKLRNILASEDVMLRYPDYKKPFHLTTDDSAYGIGAVLSQENRLITMISRTLKNREMNYATQNHVLRPFTMRFLSPTP